MDLPERPSAKPRPAGWFSLLIAAGVGFMILTALVMLTGGYLALVILVGGGVFAMAAFHYLVWGWWLSDKLRRDEAASEERAAQAERAASQAEWDASEAERQLAEADDAGNAEAADEAASHREDSVD